jgi:plasmid stabilization system protein ParE
VKPYTFHPSAAEEYANATEYYEANVPGLGGRFYDEIEDLIREIRRHPERFFRLYPPVQRALAHKFPYSVIYVNEPDRIWIVAVMHAKRRPGYWRARI